MASNEPIGLILGAGVVVTGSSVVRDVHEGELRASPIIFGFMMVTALLLISYASQPVAKGLAYMAMVGALVVNGPAVFGVTTGITCGKESDASEKAGGGSGGGRKVSGHP